MSNNQSYFNDRRPLPPPLPPIQLSKKNASTYTSPPRNHAYTNTETIGEKLGDINVNFDFDDGYPIQFYCPITLDLLEDPVITNTATTFSRRALLEEMSKQMQRGAFAPERVYRFDGSDPIRGEDPGHTLYIDSHNFKCPRTGQPIRFITDNWLIKDLMKDWPKPCNRYIIPDDAFILYKNIKNNKIPNKLLKLYNEIDKSKITDEEIEQIPDKLLELYNVAILENKLNNELISKIIEKYKKKPSNNTIKSKLSRLSRFLSRKAASVAPTGGKKKKKGSTKRITVGLKNKKRKKRLKRTRKLVVNKI
tara:strand:- start:333 stop:1253 length:921 start_codon:yes stop_codon:yes gene_type:complete